MTRFVVSVDVIPFNVSKAFNSVSHNTLASKFRPYSLAGQTTRYVKYSSDRQARRVVVSEL